MDYDTLYDRLVTEGLNPRAAAKLAHEIISSKETVPAAEPYRFPVPYYTEPNYPWYTPPLYTPPVYSKPWWDSGIMCDGGIVTQDPNIKLNHYVDFKSLPTYSTSMEGLVGFDKNSAGYSAKHEWVSQDLAAELDK